MPGWHEATKQLQAEGKVQMVGIIQEQHADRCALFMQWKRMDWPIMVDSLNLLEVTAVPLTYLIDEHGTIKASPRRANEVEAWLDEPAPEGVAPPSTARTTIPDTEEIKMRSAAARDGGFEACMEFGNDLFMWDGDNQAHHAVMVYQYAAKLEPDNPLLHFRLGVAYRRKFEAQSNDFGDFQRAIENWQTALDGDPNQYIWRRRIQQYGPRLMKPYPFYDWVPTAREEIIARGETPVELVVEPSGAEFAQRLRSFIAEATTKANPDPEAKINRDDEGFIDLKSVVVPSQVTAGGSVRVHIRMTPNEAIKAHWNNEVDDTVLWIDPPESWQVDRQCLDIKRPESIVSAETRAVEFELKLPEELNPGLHAIPVFALYYVCEDVGGKCLYRRQDIKIDVNVVE